MTRLDSLRRRPLLGVAALVATLIFIGAVMGRTHEPIAIEPDAPRADGASVATFALG